MVMYAHTVSLVLPQRVILADISCGRGQSLISCNTNMGYPENTKREC